MGGMEINQKQFPVLAVLQTRFQGTREMCSSKSSHKLNQQVNLLFMNACNRTILKMNSKRVCFGHLGDSVKHGLQRRS